MQIGFDLIELKDICILCNFFLVWITQLLFNRLPTSFCFEWKTHEKHTSFITIQFLCFFRYDFFIAPAKSAAACYHYSCHFSIRAIVIYYLLRNLTPENITSLWAILLTLYLAFYITFVMYFRASTTKLHSCEELLLSFCIILTIFHDFFSQPIQMKPIIWNTNADVIMRFFSLYCDIQACWQRKLVIISNYQVCWVNTVTTAV